jgi:hypothetical protein
MTNSQEVPSPPPVFPFHAGYEPLAVEETSAGETAPVERTGVPGQIGHQPIPVLAIAAQHLYMPFAELATLPPSQLLQELLGRVLVGGIGRLFFQRTPQLGRILWSQNGILQSALEGLDLMLFQSVLNELKALLQLPPMPLLKSRQFEVERLYGQTRLLLRLHLITGKLGEEATLQVLRGTALKFHQQQQLTTLSMDAVNLARQLQLKVSEIRIRAASNAQLQREQLEALPTLEQLVNNLQLQLQELRRLQTHPLDRPNP